MALQFDPKSSGTTGKTRKVVDDDSDWDFKMDDKMEDVTVTSRELPGQAISRYSMQKNLDPVSDLKNRLSRWGELYTAFIYAVELIFNRS